MLDWKSQVGSAFLLCAIDGTLKGQSLIDIATGRKLISETAGGTQQTFPNAHLDRIWAFGRNLSGLYHINLCAVSAYIQILADQPRPR